MHVHCCRVWQSATRDLGAATTVRVARGGKVTVRISRRVDFALA